MQASRGQQRDAQTNQEEVDLKRLQVANNEFNRSSKIPVLFLNLLFGYTILEIWILILAAAACIATEFCVFKELEEAASTKAVIITTCMQATLPIMKIPFLYFTFKYIRERKLRGLQILTTIAFGTILYSYFQSKDPSAISTSAYIFGLGYPISIILCYGKLKKLRAVERKMNITEPANEH